MSNLSDRDLLIRIDERVGMLVPQVKKNSRFRVQSLAVLAAVAFVSAVVGAFRLI